MPRKQHVHKYIKRPTGSSPVWACALEDCNHYMPSHLTMLVEGRSTLCWNCGEKFKLDKQSMKRDMPVCVNCEMGISAEEITEENVFVPPSIQVNKPQEIESNNSTKQIVCYSCGEAPVAKEGHVCIPCTMHPKYNSLLRKIVK